MDKLLNCDLHIHTTASDGTLPTAEIARRARAAGLDVIAITDHDTLDGLVSIPQLGGLKIIPGIELSIDVPQNETHILGLGIDPLSKAWHENDLISKLKNTRVERIYTMCALLCKCGYALRPEQVFALVPAGATVGRIHVAEALVANGLVSDIHYAFRNLINVRGPAYVRRYKLSVYDAINVIKRSGGTAIMAHPALCRDDDVVRAAIAAGIDGLEVYYPRHNRCQTATYRNLCATHKLIATGGSDLHSKPGRYPETIGAFYVRLPESIIHSIF